MSKLCLFVVLLLAVGGCTGGSNSQVRKMLPDTTADDIADPKSFGRRLLHTWSYYSVAFLFWPGNQTVLVKKASARATRTSGLSASKIQAGLDSPEFLRPDIDIVSTSIKPTCVTQRSLQALNTYLKPRNIHIITTSKAGVGGRCHLASLGCWILCLPVFAGEEKCVVFRSHASNVVCHVQDTFLAGNVTLSSIAAFRGLGVEQPSRPG
jgi:hypothetical protein